VKKGTTAVLVLGLGGVLAACGGGGSSVSSPAKKSKPASQSATATSGTVDVANSKLGKILVDANGRTLYAFDHDTPTMSACTTANGCAGLWPPLMMTGQPTGGTGVTASMLSVLAGGTQVVYGGHPLYTFANDTAPGDLKGQGFAGNIWHVVSPTGQTVTAAVPANTPASSGSGSGSGSGGYGY
jgi:predicted lipoprotein with Yx(FWY)xxD motif